MRKILLPLAAILLIAAAVPTFADRGEWELGLGWTPSQDIVNQTILNFHVAYAWSILYLSWDAYAMPAYWVYNATTYTDPWTGTTYDGIPNPGFLNLFDVGVRFYVRPVIAYAEIGTNLLYIYGGQIYKSPDGSSGVGVNARAGIGVRFGWWGVNVSGTQVFATWNDMKAAFGQAANGNWSKLTYGSVASFNATLYF